MKKQAGTKLENPDLTYFEVDQNRELRCPFCAKLLSKGKLALGSCIQIKCTRCRELCSYKAV
jgi:uncharacterized protein (UPF0212 family)